MLAPPMEPTAEPAPEPIRVRLTPAWWEHFRVGELLPWRGVTFRVAAVGPAGLLLEAVHVKLRKLARSGPVNMQEVPTE